MASTKGSINLNDYIGCEHGFNLDKEAHSLALIFKQIILVLAFDERETLMKWQVQRVSISKHFHLLNIPITHNCALQISHLQLQGVIEKITLFCWNWLKNWYIFLGHPLCIY